MAPEAGEKPMDLDEAAGVFTDPKAYAHERRFHSACAVLRAQSPVHRVDVAGFNPFFAVTKHADVMEISRQPERWLNAPRPALGPASADESRGNIPIRSLVQMDAPDHPKYRHITLDWFKPKNVERLDHQITQLATRFVDRLAELGGECDFVTDVAVHYPLYVIMSLLGLPEEDFPRMLQLTQELFGASDPERGRDDPDALRATLMDFVAYFQRLTEERRAEPGDDLASAIANARIDGELMETLEAAGYYVLIATAGHDTTSASIAGGLHALLDHPDQLQRLQEHPELVPTAVDEMIRWVSPVKQFMRTATEDYDLRGTSIGAGESVLLSYPSANRDEDVFVDSQRFDVGRDPNRHVGFGFGAHFCLGSNLARREGRALFAELMPRLRSIELAGEPSYMETTFVGGPKHLPIRYEFR
jgi:cytochrome P450